MSVLSFGRRRSERLGQGKLGDYLAQAVAAKLASASRFERLARGLREHAAPPALQRDAMQARDDKLRHAQRCGQLARSWGAIPEKLAMAGLDERTFDTTLEDVARENGVGCVKETYASLISRHQAAHARDAGLRKVLRVIAEDEARHAILVHRVHGWAMHRLDASACGRVRLAQAQALQELAQGRATSMDAGLVEAAGLPPLQVARSILDTLVRQLWDLP